MWVIQPVAGHRRCGSAQGTAGPRSPSPSGNASVAMLVLTTAFHPGFANQVPHREQLGAGQTTGFSKATSFAPLRWPLDHGMCGRLAACKSRTTPASTAWPGRRHPRPFADRQFGRSVIQPLDRCHKCRWTLTGGWREGGGVGGIPRCPCRRRGRCMFHGCLVKNCQLRIIGPDRPVPLPLSWKNAESGSRAASQGTWSSPFGPAGCRSSRIRICTGRRLGFQAFRPPGLAVIFRPAARLSGTSKSGSVLCPPVRSSCRSLRAAFQPL